jgi:hypothetical protein
MNESLDKSISFLVENIEKDSRIYLHKKMKYGFRYYYLVLSIDNDDNSGSISNNGGFSFRESFEICFDNRNKCLEINSFTEDSIIVEDIELLEKWNPILEEIINRDIESKIKNSFEQSLVKCHNKSLHREYQMKKIL